MLPMNSWLEGNVTWRTGSVLLTIHTTIKVSSVHTTDLLTLSVVSAGYIFPQSLLLTSTSSLCLCPVGQVNMSARTHTHTMKHVTTICVVYIWCKCLNRGEQKKQPSSPSGTSLLSFHTQTCSLSSAGCWWWTGSREFSELKGRHEKELSVKPSALSQSEAKFQPLTWLKL